MYDICGERSDGKVLNCPYAIPAVKPDELFSAKIQSLCPTISGNVCCTEAQFDTLRAQVQQAIPLLVGCPACLRNFLNLFCELSCSPNQGSFINVTSIIEFDGDSTVDGIDFYVSDDFGEGLYESCKDVKSGTMNTRAIDFVGAGAKNFREWFTFIGQRAELDMPGSPYAISFQSGISGSSPMKLMNVSIYSCGDTSLGCSCGDCPSSPACSSLEPSHPPENVSCLIRLGPFMVKCIDFSMGILCVLLVSAFIGWAFSHHSQERRPGSNMDALLSEAAPVDKFKKDEIYGPTMKVDGDARVRLSPVQKFITGVYRRYGMWIAKNPALALCSSVAMVLILSLGLIRFEVET